VAHADTARATMARRAWVRAGSGRRRPHRRRSHADAEPRSDLQRPAQHCSVAGSPQRALPSALRALTRYAAMSANGHRRLAYAPCEKLE
jgi:hypothetical protein